MNLTHLVMFSFWTGASEVTALSINIGQMRFTLGKQDSFTVELEKQDSFAVTLGVES